ncbi:MAG: hypothetical protein JO102_06665 [Elusimicrobia bacterium]|nr:hypothetical protein [Elusimicrobiota bacterium]
MLEQLPSLIALQQHDIAVDELSEKAKQFDPLIQKKTKALDALRADLKSAKDKLSGNTLKKKELEGEVESKQALVKKHQGELNSLKSNDAYKAMLGEIENAKNAVREAEDKILVVMEAIDAGDREYKEREKKFKTDEAALKAEIQKIEQEKAAAADLAAKRKQERDAYAATLPANVVSQYDAIRKKRGGLAIVPMVNNSCAGCHMQLPPHRVNEVKKAKVAVMCESCNRILYLPPEPTNAVPANNAGTAKDAAAPTGSAS